MGCGYNSSFNLIQLNNAIERGSLIKTISFYLDNQLLLSFVGGKNTKILEQDVSDFIKTNQSTFYDDQSNPLSLPYTIGDSDVIFNCVSESRSIYHAYGSSNPNNYGNVLQARFSNSSFLPSESSDAIEWTDVLPALGSGFLFSDRYVQFRIKATVKAAADGGYLLRGDRNLIIKPNYVPAEALNWVESDVFDTTSGSAYTHFYWDSGYKRSE